MITIQEHAHFSPNFAPCNSFSFLQAQRIVEGTRFEGAEAIKRDITTKLRSIQEEPFQHLLIEFFFCNKHLLAHNYMVLIYEDLYFDLAQGQMNGAPNETHNYMVSYI